MRDLLQGHVRFRHDYAARERDFLSRLASAKQSPSTLYIGCSDSRVVPELLTGSAPGELFVVRNVANLVPPLDHRDASVGAAIDYAIGVLHVEHVVICGHIGCGGVKAILDGHDGLRPYPSLHEWLDGAAPGIHAGHDPSRPAQEAWDHAVGRNVLGQMANLETYGVVAEALDAGRLQLHGWIYDMANGHVRVLDAESGAFVDATEMV
jgi:carbonic anhydrase